MRTIIMILCFPKFHYVELSFTNLDHFMENYLYLSSKKCSPRQAHKKRFEHFPLGKTSSNGIL
jgi:hypothetical protein